MPLDASEQNQLTVILILAILLYIVASSLPQKVATTVLMIFVPVQVIETRFGTSSVVLAYVVFIALLLRKERLHLPMLPHFLFLFLWYLVSMSLMPSSTYVQHGIYMFSLLSAFCVFWLCYDLTGRLESSLSIVNVFIAMNVLVAIYCGIQLWLGPGERYVFFGIDEINMTRVRADGRLTGPFQSAEITAQYLVLMEFLLLHQFWHTSSRWYKSALTGLAAVNAIYLIATGSRGEFLLLIGGGFIYLWLFRKRLGVGRAMRLAVAGTLVLTVTALAVANFTQFGGLYDRLAETEFNEQGIPDTRQFLWPEAWKEIVKSPIIGHGPRLRFFQEDRGVRYEDHVYISFPHNLYLFLLFTVGVPGLMLFVLILFVIFSRCWRAMSKPDAPLYYQDLTRTGVIIITLFVIDGIKIDQMRFNLVDYWHFFFGLCGVLIASCSKVAKESLETRTHDTNEPKALERNVAGRATMLTYSRTGRQ